MFGTQFQPTAVIKEAEVERAFNEPQKWWNTARRAKLLESAVSSKPPSQRRLNALFLRRGGKVKQTNKKKESEVGLKSRRAKKENAKRWKKRLFLSALCTFSNQSGDNGGGDNSTEAFPPAAYTEDGFRGAKIKISRGETLVWRAPRAP